jgi:hypothetical protein
MKKTGMNYLIFIMVLMAVLSAGCIFVKNNNPPAAPKSEIIYVTVAPLTPVPGTHVSVNPTGTVDRTTEVVATIAAMDADLQTFRTHIDERAVQGFDISIAEAKYNEALQKINAARKRPSNQITEALADLKAASIAIRDGENSLT